MSAKLQTEQNTPAVMRKIRGAFRQMFGRRVFGTFYEHGQWWVSCEDLDGDDAGEALFSVVDAEGPGSINGFGFERT
jgi:hypothetical protein